MLRAVGLIALLTAAVVRGDSSPTVGDLIKRLGDPKFAVREAAHKELLRRGEGIVPELDRLAKTTDAETAERLAKVRYALVGYKEEILQRILDIKKARGLFNPIPGELDIPNDLRDLIAAHQPGSGDLLVTVATDPKHHLWYETLHMLVQTWDLMTADQLGRYVEKTVTVGTTHRPQFPAGVPATISFGAGPRDSWDGWPGSAPKGSAFRARTTRYLDGKPYDKPVEYPHPYGPVGRFDLGRLSEGTHTIRAVMEYEITQNGQTRKGEIRSKDSTFEIVAADTPDDLLAPKSAETAKAVREAISIVSREGYSDDIALPEWPPLRGFANPQDAAWPAQVTWPVDKDTRAGLHCPVWQIKLSVPVDLCFEAEIRDLKTGTVYPCFSPIVVHGHPAGQPSAPPPAPQGQGYFMPDDFRGFAKGRDGFVTVKVVLKPSRALALSDPRVAKYFPEEIESAELKMKVFPKIEPPAVHK
jgi:hypothetical protein